MEAAERLTGIVIDETWLETPLRRYRLLGPPPATLQADLPESTLRRYPGLAAIIANPARDSLPDIAALAARMARDEPTIADRHWPAAADRAFTATSAAERARIAEELNAFALDLSRTTDPMAHRQMRAVLGLVALVTEDAYPAAIGAISAARNTHPGVDPEKDVVLRRLDACLKQIR